MTTTSTGPRKTGKPLFWKNERFSGPGSPSGLDFRQAEWLRLLRNREENPADRPVIVLSFSKKSARHHGGPEPVPVVKLNQQRFYEAIDVQLTALYLLPEELLFHNGRTPRDRLHFTGLTPQVDRAGAITYDAAKPWFGNDLFKAPVGPHQEFKTVKRRGDICAMNDGTLEIVNSDIYCDLVVDGAIHYRLQQQDAPSLQLRRITGDMVRKGHTLATLEEPIEFGVALLNRAGRWAIDYGGGELVRAFDEDVLTTANEMWAMQQQHERNVEGAEIPYDFTTLLPRAYHRFTQDALVKINTRRPELVAAFCHAIGPGAADEEAYQLRSPCTGEVTEIKAMESYPIDSSDSSQGTMKFWSIRIGDKLLPGRLPGSAAIYVKVGDQVSQGQTLADMVSRDYYESLVDVQAVAPGNIADWLIRDFANRNRVVDGQYVYWPTHLVSQESLPLGRACLDVSPLQAAPATQLGTPLLSLVCDPLETFSVNGVLYSLTPHGSLFDNRHPENIRRRKTR